MSTDTSPSNFVAPEPEEIAELLPNFEVLSFIAKGGMGAVYLAKQKSLDREVAIKILPRNFGEDLEFRTSFESEAKSMAKLNHPNLIGIYDFGEIDGLLYIVMEMVHGTSLYHASYGKKIDPIEAGRIICEICHGLENAHQHGILHRDIKPANILLNDQLSPKIGDFGLARPVGDHESDTAFGTPGYTAPEVVHNPSAVDESTDLYSVGVMLYELLTSKLPEKLYMPVANLVQCDPRFDDIIRKAMNPDPVLRFRTAKSMAEAIDAILNKKKSSAISNPLIPSSSSAGGSVHPPRPLSPPVYTKKSSSPTIRNMIIIIVLLAAIYGSWTFYQKKKATREAENAQTIVENERKKAEAVEKKAKIREQLAREAQARKEARSKMIAEIQAANKEITPLPEQPPKPIAEVLVKCAELEEVREKCRGLVGKMQKKFGGNRREQFLQEIKQLRGFYRNKLTKIKASLEAKGINDQARTVDKELNATNVPGQAFVDYILGNN